MLEQKPDWDRVEGVLHLSVTYLLHFKETEMIIRSDVCGSKKALGQS